MKHSSAHDISAGTRRALAGSLWLALLGLMLGLPTLGAYAQDKLMSPPRVMVVPDDSYCSAHGYTYTISSTNGEEQRPDYKRAIREDQTLNAVLTQVKELIMERNDRFKIVDLLTSVDMYDDDQVMNLLNAADDSETDDEAILRSADADILIKLNFEILKTGPQRQAQVTLIGADAYTGQQFAPVSGVGTPSTSVNSAVLVREAVYNKMDDFLQFVLNYYANMETQGRAVAFYFRMQEDSEVDMNTRLGELTLAQIIEDSLYDNSVDGIGLEQSQGGASFLNFPSVHIPLTAEVRGHQRRQSAANVAERIAETLDGYDVECIIKQAGLGKVYVYLK